MIHTRFRELIRLGVDARYLDWASTPQGGGKGKPPPPDPLIGQAAQANAQVAREALEFSKRQYEESKPRQAEFDELVRRVVGQQLQIGDENQALAREYADYMRTVFHPLEREIVADARAFDTEGRRREEAGRAMSDVRGAFETQRGILRRERERMGVNAASGASQALDAEMAAREAAAVAGAGTAARRNVETLGLARRMDAASLGRNLPANQATSAQVALSAAGSAAGTGAQPLNQFRANAGLMQQGFGTAIQGYGSAGNLALGGYNAQLDAFRSAQQSRAGLFSGLGSIAGYALGGGFGAALGDRLFQRPVTVGGGFRYGGIARRYGLEHSYRRGGLVRGPGGPTEDAIPARLSDGEAVLNAGAVKIVGEDFVHRVNRYGLDLLRHAADSARGADPTHAHLARGGTLG